MDVIMVYIQGDLSEKIYMNQPEAFHVKGQEDKVCLLKQSLYRLNNPVVNGIRN